MYFDYAERRTRLAKTLQLTDEVLVVGAGNPLPKPELSDQMLPFIAHQEYYYLTGIADAFGGIVAFDPHDQKGGRGDAGWVLFVPEITESDRLWQGRQQLPGELLDKFTAWFDARKKRPVILLGSPVPGIRPDELRTADVREIFLHSRRLKEPAEMDLMRHCAYKTAAGYAAVQPMLRPGFSERRIQVEIEAEYFRRGATRAGYDTIVGSGPNSALLHASPSQRAFKEGDFILIDSGAEVDRYVIDVTRTYVAGRPTAFQRDLFQIVVAAQNAAIARCQPGAEWKDIHLSAASDLVAGLVDLGIMRGNPSSLLEQDAHTLFFPHGIGHMVGLGVRDASGHEPGRPKDPRPSLAHLRMDLILRSSYIVTVEPGLYFIPALLNNPLHRKFFHDCVNWSMVDQHIDVGGVRIEDTILVNHGMPENLTRMIPKTI
ncbi:MAG TPA: aminopeptidase P N-terminal domain-containing protein [Lacunisphaera sp.]